MNYEEKKPHEIHALCRGGRPSYKDEVKAFVLKDDASVEVEAGDMIFMNVCFDNRGSKHNPSHKIDMSESDVIEKIESKLDGSISVEPMAIDKKKIDEIKKDGKVFGFKNSYFAAFLVADVSDQEKFNKILKNGIGSRRSYGFGLMLVMNKSEELK